MRKNRLYEDFFKENPVDETSAPFISDFTLAALFNDTMVAEMERSIAGKISDERKARISADKAAVEQLTSGEEIVSYMRKNHDVIADSAFCKKALTMEDEAVPLIIKRYKTTFQDRFVEVAFFILSKADRKYAEQLFREYKDIRNPYAQSMACLLFGEQQMEETGPFLMEECRRFQRVYPQETYHQAPLLALHIMFGTPG